MGITFGDAVKKATHDGETDHARAWAIAVRAARLYLANTRALEPWQWPEYLRWAQELAIPQTGTEFWDQANQVRDFVVQEHYHNNICEEGSNDFLNWVGLEPLSQPQRDFAVTVTVTLTFAITGSRHDLDWVERDVRDYLRVTADGNVDDADFDDVEVRIDNLHVEEC
jgi:hypothetical protein